jgi:hypothetical protein
LNHIGLDKFGAAIILADQDYRADALYTYQLEGKTYQGKRISPWVIVASHNAQRISSKNITLPQRTQRKRLSIIDNLSSL